METRSIAGHVQLRSDEAAGIVGYAAKFYRADDSGTEFRLWDGAVERIMPGAFDAALSDDVRALFNHDASQILGRTKSGTLKLSVDDIGLRYEIAPADTRVYADVANFLSRGDVDGSSFQFQILPGGERWTRSGSTEVREITSVKLFDVGPVTFPAYEAATSGVRSVEMARQTREAWAQQMQRSAKESAQRRQRCGEVLARLVAIQNAIV